MPTTQPKPKARSITRPLPTVAFKPHREISVLFGGSAFIQFGEGKTLIPISLTDAMTIFSDTWDSPHMEFDQNAEELLLAIADALVGKKKMLAREMREWVRAMRSVENYEFPASENLRAWFKRIVKGLQVETPSTKKGS